ncbi:CPBP family intramembrane glutamic endopeptidase [Neobacillus sp. D3-1R]|uniref:CPBP family intramembrane glutamic endopeptidase n=1 Tax=Neobacillus sp. D3-1R TaxID=3445778 RepID=UPI003F9EDAED
MKKSMLDIRLVIGFLLAHLLFFFISKHHQVFWYMFTASMLILISYSIIKEEVDDAVSIRGYLTYGMISGFLLFVLFFLGNQVLNLIKIPVQDQIVRLYDLFSPTLFWHFISLLLIAVPGEEIFWRGFIQKRLLQTGFWSSILISSFMNASINIYTGEWILVFAALLSGIFWGFLYAWKRSLPLVIVSHLIFDLFIFFIFPLENFQNDVTLSHFFRQIL